MRIRLRLPRFLLVLTSALVLIAASTAVQQADPARYLNDIKSLASPEMEGRGAGTKGLTRAEHLIEKRYKELGISPAGVNGYAQPFTVITGARLKSDNHFVVQAAESKNDLKINQEFVPFSFSASGQVTASPVFAGYGVTADEFHYDDYAGLDVKDKIVVVLRYEPSGFAEKSGNHGLTQHSQLVTQSHQCAESWSEGCCRTKWKTRRWRRRLAHALRQRQWPGERGLSDGAGKERGGGTLVSIVGEIPERPSGPDQLSHETRVCSLSPTRSICRSISTSRPHAQRSTMFSRGCPARAMNT